MSAWCESCRSYVVRVASACPWCETRIVVPRVPPVVAVELQFATLAILVLNHLETKDVRHGE